MAVAPNEVAKRTGHSNCEWVAAVWDTRKVHTQLHEQTSTSSFSLFVFPSRRPLIAANLHELGGSSSRLRGDTRTWKPANCWRAKTNNACLSATACLYLHCALLLASVGLLPLALRLPGCSLLAIATLARRANLTATVGCLAACPFAPPPPTGVGAPRVSAAHGRADGRRTDVRSNCYLSLSRSGRRANEHLAEVGSFVFVLCPRFSMHAVAAEPDQVVVVGGPSGPSFPRSI